jgi:hypothetical protein
MTPPGQYRRITLPLPFGLQRSGKHTDGVSGVA